jgi:molecular chaperone IbpA
MRTVDFAPLYRSSVGFDHLLNMLENASRLEQKNGGYPPYNIEALDKDRYMITLAVAGFAESDLSIESNLNRLTIKGQQPQDEPPRNFLHQGIASRNFERTFELADHVRVVSAQLQNGLLRISLEREIPEAMKPRTIPIGAGESLN